MPATQSSPVQTSSHPLSSPQLAALCCAESLVSPLLGTLSLFLLHGDHVTYFMETMETCELLKSILCGGLKASYDNNNCRIRQSD